MRRVLSALGICLIAVVVSAGPASAASSVSLTLSASRVAQGGLVTVSGQCEPSTSGDVISAAFLHNAGHDFAGVGAVSFTTGTSGKFSVVATVPRTRSAGTYGVTARCGGGNLGLSRSLTVVQATLARTGDGAALPATVLGLLMLAAGVALIAVDRRVAGRRG
jgi:hypothetical protein